MRANAKSKNEYNKVIAYLDQIIASPDKYKQYTELSHQSNLEMSKSEIESDLSAIKSAMLLNGGAAIAMLAFIAYLSESRPFSISVLAPTILPFTLGAFASGLIYGGRYLAQTCYAHKKTKWGDRITHLCIALGVASYTAFFVGILYVYSVLSGKL